MKKILYAVALALFIFLTEAGAVSAETVTFQWDKVTTTASGDPLSSAAGTNLIAYKLYISQVSGGYGAPTIAFISPAATGTVESYKYTNNVRGSYFAVATAYNAKGESDWSNEVSFNITAQIPAKSTTLTVKKVE